MTIPGECADACAAEGAYAENSQAKGLEPDGPPESLIEAPKKQSPDLPEGKAAQSVPVFRAFWERIFQVTRRSAPQGALRLFISPAEARWQNLKEEDYYERIKTDHSL